MVLSNIFSLLFGQESPEQLVIRTKVNVVNVVCTARDNRGRYLSNLTKEQFEVFEDGVPQTIEFFYNRTKGNSQELTIVLLIDTSGSVKDKLEFEKIAASEFLRSTLNKGKDMAAIMQFDSEINLAQDFTYDLAKLEDAIHTLRSGGGTKLYDAIWLAVEDLLEKEVGRRILVILSDGADTQSSVSEERAICSAQKADVVIYGIGIKSRRFDANFRKLKKFSESTGGAFFNSKASLDRLRGSFRRINREIKNQYILSYTSTNLKEDEIFRKIRVKVKLSGLKIIHRKGYYTSIKSY